MYLGKRNIAIIPARGGSKGLPGKNIKHLLGKPLIAWSIEQAQASKYIDEVFVSTDSEETADIAKEYGVPVPSLRPAEISTDTSPSSEFIIYTLNLLREQGKEFDYVILLEPTSPLRKEDDLDNAITKLLSTPDADGIISLGKVHMEHPSIVKIVDQDGHVRPYVEREKRILRRQEADDAYFPYGVIYMTSCDNFYNTKSFYSGKVIPFFIERWQNYEIDDLYDFLCIETILKYSLCKK